MYMQSLQSLQSLIAMNCQYRIAIDCEASKHMKPGTLTEDS
jgi:hypothetical protein